MKIATFVVGGLLFTGLGVGARPTLDLYVTPAVSFAPSTLRIRATIAPDADNRAIAIVAESDGFFRSSELPLAGDRAPRTIFLEYRGIPSGTYEVRGIVVGSRGNELAVAQRTVNVIGGDSH